MKEKKQHKKIVRKGLSLPALPTTGRDLSRSMPNNRTRSTRQAYYTTIPLQMQLKNTGVKKKNRNAVDAAKLKEQLRRLNNIYMAGNISDSEYQEQAATVKRLIAEVEQLEEESKEPIRLDALRALLNDDFEAKYQQLSREEKQRFWHEIISAIHFDDNQVSEITFKV